MCFLGASPNSSPLVQENRGEPKMLCVTAKGLGHIWPQSGRMGGLIVAFSILRRVKLANPLGLVWVSPLTPFFLLNIIIHSYPMCLRRNGYAEATYISKHNTFTLFNTIPSETSWALAFPISRFLERTKKGLWSNRPIFSNKAIYHVTSPKPPGKQRMFFHYEFHANIPHGLSNIFLVQQLQIT
jgi:hypothetical protein